MDLVRYRITCRFIEERARLSWTEVLFGLASELLDPQAAVEIATDVANRTTAPSAVLVELEKARDRDSIIELVRQLAASEAPQSEEGVRNKWLYLALAWTYETRNQNQDPLQRVEELYADFDYPSVMTGFVRYMPMEGADLGSRELNESRLFERWKQYLDEATPLYLAGIPLK